MKSGFEKKTKDYQKRLTKKIINREKERYTRISLLPKKVSKSLRKA